MYIWQVYISPRNKTFLVLDRVIHLFGYTIVMSVGVVLDFVDNCLMVIVWLHISNMRVTRGLLCV